MMTYAEVCIRERQENVTEDYIRGAVWAIMKVYELVPYDRTKTYKERIDMILDLEKTFPDYIAAEKESFEFNRGATHGLESFALRVAKDESLDYGDRLTIMKRMPFRCIRKSSLKVRRKRSPSRTLPKS